MVAFLSGIFQRKNDRDLSAETPLLSLSGKDLGQKAALNNPARKKDGQALGHENLKLTSVRPFLAKRQTLKAPIGGSVHRESSTEAKPFLRSPVALEKKSTRKNDEKPSKSVAPTPSTGKHKSEVFDKKFKEALDWWKRSDVVSETDCDAIVKLSRPQKKYLYQHEGLLYEAHHESVAIDFNEFSKIKSNILRENRDHPEKVFTIRNLHPRDEVRA